MYGERTHRREGQEFDLSWNEELGVPSPRLAEELERELARFHEVRAKQMILLQGNTAMPMDGAGFNCAGLIDIFTTVRDRWIVDPTEANRFRILTDLIFDLRTYSKMPKFEAVDATSAATKASWEAADFARQWAIRLFWPPQAASGCNSPRPGPALNAKMGLSRGPCDARPSTRPEFEHRGRWP